jgi:hypothetical protein
MIVKDYVRPAALRGLEMFDPLTHSAYSAIKSSSITMITRSTVADGRLGTASSHVRVVLTAFNTGGWRTL